jgi:trk system potassium uptake protein TrkA
MYIIVVGGGRVGYHLTKELLDESHEVLIIEKNATICDNINEELGNICVRGDGCEASTLAEAGAERADIVIAVTGDDEDNLVACQVAKYKFQVRRSISRIRNPRNEVLFKKLGVDVTISSTNVILEAIEEEMPTHPLIHLLTIRERGLEIVEINIPPESEAIGRKVKDLPLPPETNIFLIISKDRKPETPAPDTVIAAGDQIIALTPADSEEKLRQVMQGRTNNQISKL